MGLSARGALVIGQVALSMVLLIGAALLIESLVRLYGVNPGFNPSHLLTMQISLPPLRYDTGQKQAAFFDELALRVQALPGVRSAAATFTLPLTIFPQTPVQLANQPPQPLNQRPLAAIQNVTPPISALWRVPLKRGREFSERDDAAAPLTAIINESLARVLWPAYPSGLDPVGQRILIGAKANPVEIVGIVADMHQDSAKRPVARSVSPFRPESSRVRGFLRADGGRSSSVRPCRKGSGAGDRSRSTRLRVQDHGRSDGSRGRRAPRASVAAGMLRGRGSAAGRDRHLRCRSPIRSRNAGRRWASAAHWAHSTRIYCGWWWVKDWR